MNSFSARFSTLITTIQTKARNLAKSPIFWAKFAGFAIPLGFLLYVLYFNYLPFGYDKAFTINIGSPNDTKISEFYLEPSSSLSESKKKPDGTSYRELNGLTSAIFKPKVPLRDAEITIETKDSGVLLIPPFLNSNTQSIQWDHDWDFTKGVPNELTNEKVFPFDGGIYFNASARLQLPNSKDLFENSPLTLYVEWTPQDDQNNFQEIIGHYNWELVQNKNSVQLQVGRMNNATGSVYSVMYPVDADFFNVPHSATAIYDPSEDGSVTLFIDEKFAGRTPIAGDKIWTNYGEENLSLGWTPHNYGKSPHFMGLIKRVAIATKNSLIYGPRTVFNTLNYQDPFSIPIIAPTTTDFTNLRLHVEQK